MPEKSTETIQNIINRLKDEMALNVENPSSKLKKQYHKVNVAFINLQHELDIVNDMKEAL